MYNSNNEKWHINKQINISTIIQIILLASLILGSWLNIQYQLNTLENDISQILKGQKCFAEKVENLSSDVFANKYEIRIIKSQLSEEDI